MNYLNIGSIGFAQLGSPDYYEKRQIENQVLQEAIQAPEWAVPEEFKDNAYIGIKSFRYDDLGSYDEVVLYYTRAIEDLEWNGLDDDKHERFWEWANTIESIDLETEENLTKCKYLYSKLVQAEAAEPKMEVVHQRPKTLKKVAL